MNKTLLLAVFAVLVAHALLLAKVSPGLFSDEAALGYNAILLSQSLKDQHGTVLPLYVHSYEGTMLDPISLYLTTAVFLVFGPSDWNLRVTSLSLFGLTLVCLLNLAGSFSKPRPASRLAVLLLGSLPWLFQLSHLAFSVNALIAVSALLVCVLWRVFNEPDNLPRHFFLIGLLCATAVYAYPAGRLLAFLWLGAFLCGMKNTLVREQVRLTLSGFVLGLIPLLLFLCSPENSSLLQLRFSEVSTPTPGFLSWLARTGQHYFLHFSPDFLLLAGDRNIRHHSGFGGELSFCCFLLAVYGIATSRKEDPKTRRFLGVLFGLLLLAPLPAALTSEALPHAVRSAPFAVFFASFALIGLARLQALPSPRIARICSSLLFLLCFLESTRYVSDYVQHYTQRSANAYDSYQLGSALEQAERSQPSQITLSTKYPKAHLQYYAALWQHRSAIPIGIGKSSGAVGTCFLEPELDAVSSLWKTRLECFGEIYAS